MSYDSGPRFDQLKDAMRGRVAWEVDPERLASIMAPEQVESADLLWLREMVAERGDPRLSAWEEEFLVSIARLIETPRPWPTRKQADVLRRIDAKLRQPAVEDEFV